MKEGNFNNFQIGKFEAIDCNIGNQNYNWQLLNNNESNPEFSLKINNYQQIDGLVDFSIKSKYEVEIMCTGNNNMTMTKSFTINQDEQSK